MPSRICGKSRILTICVVAAFNVQPYCLYYVNSLLYPQGESFNTNLARLCVGTKDAQLLTVPVGQMADPDSDLLPVPFRFRTFNRILDLTSYCMLCLNVCAASHLISGHLLKTAPGLISCPADGMLKCEL